MILLFLLWSGHALVWTCFGLGMLWSGHAFVAQARPDVLIWFPAGLQRRPETLIYILSCQCRLREALAETLAAQSHQAGGALRSSESPAALTLKLLDQLILGEEVRA